MATIKPVSFNRLPEIDENDGKVILHDGSQLGRSTKELGEIIDDRLRTGLEDGKQYAMTTSGWKDVVIPEVDLTPYAYSAGLEADKQFVMTDNGWAEVDLSPYALSADVDSKAEEISSWANETFLTGVDLSNYYNKTETEQHIETTANEIIEEVNSAINEVYNYIDDTSAYLDEVKQDNLEFGYDNDAISAINGSALAIPQIDLSNYYTKTETSGKEELFAEFNTKQDIIANKKDSSIPYLEISGSEPSWEVIESEQINAHGTAQEGEVYTTTINGRTYPMVCLNGKLWLAENYVDESHALHTDEDYGSYFMANTISRYIPQGWHLPSKEEWESLQNAHSDELEKLFSTDWHTDPNRPDYIQCTNELKLNLTPGGYYNRNTSEVLLKGYRSYYATSTFETLSDSSQEQRVYVQLNNCVERKSQMISFNWDGPIKADSSSPGNIRLIKDDLDVSGPDCWKTFKGKKFMAIADDEGNTLKDFYLKKVEAQATYQPLGSYASSADVETLNTYYALTTTGWKDITEGFYDKTSINNSLSLKQDNLLTTRANDGDVLTYSDTDGIVWAAPQGGGGGNPYTKVSVTPGTSYANGNVTDYGWNLFDQDVNIVNNTYSIVSEEIGYDSSKYFPDSHAIDVFKIKLPANTDFPMAVVEFQLKTGENASVNKVEVYVGDTKLTQVKDAPYRDDAVVGKSIDYDNEIVHHTEFGNNYWTLGGIWDRNIASAYTGIVNDSSNHIYVKVQVHIFGSCFRVMTSHQGDIPPAS